MPSTVDPSKVNELVLSAKDYWQLGIASIALIFSVFSWWRSDKATASNIQLTARINDLNNQRHWRKEKIYTLADSLFELSALYWLADEDSAPENKMRALKIRLNLQDIEDNATAIGVDVSREIRILRDEITGGNFEAPDRKALSSDHRKFHQIQIEIQSIKLSISPSIKRAA